MGSIERWGVAVVTAGVLGCAGCASDPGSLGDPRQGDPTTGASSGFTLSIPDRSADGYLPEWATASVPGYCDGENRSPALGWTGAPEGTRSFMVTLTDPAHPEFTHWVLTGVPGDAEGVPSAQDGVPPEGVTGRSGLGDGRYVGVCVPENEYVYTVYALGEDVRGEDTTDLAEAEAIAQEHALAVAEATVRRR